MRGRRLGTGGAIGPAGTVGTRVIRAARPPGPLTTEQVKYYTDPHHALTEEAADWRSDNCRAVRAQQKIFAWARRFQIPTIQGSLWLEKVTADGRHMDFGLASLRVVTDTGVGFIVDAFQNIVELENMKFHGIGTGATAESAAQAALITELTTQLNPDSTRATGNTTEAAANIYQTVATNAVDSAVAVTEHAVFSQAATGGGVMLDRSVFAAVNLASGDSVQTDYRLSLIAGS